MTHEEAKKMGATHIDDKGVYLKNKNGRWWVWFDRWQSIGNPPITAYGIKPL